MINIVYCTNKTTSNEYIINSLKNDHVSNMTSFLIIPDQEALQFERLTLAALPSSSQLSLEVLGFSRLYNRVCREYGGLSYSYVTKPMRSLLMWKTLRELSGMLEEYNGYSGDRHTADSMISAINEFKANGITAAEIELASKKMPEDAPLRRRLRDIALIYSCYDNFISEKYTDSADDLSKLCDILKDHDFFNGSNVYITSFTSFTAVQHRIIDLMFASAENVTVIVPLPDPTYEDISTGGVCESHKKLLRSAQRYGSYQQTVIDNSHVGTSPAISYLAENLWKLDADKQAAPSANGVIICERCDDPYSEAEAVAAHITNLLRNGARCRDIVIIARDCEKYRGILDTALEKSNIPYYISPKSDLCSLPAVKFLLSALRIKKYGWQRSDVLSHLKTGLCDIAPKDINLFDDYVNTWNIQGEQFLAEQWTMNPDGFTEEISERGHKILEAANRVRTALTAPLLKLFISLDASESIGDMCKAMYTYTRDVCLEDKLCQLAQKASLRGDLKQARELSGIYGVILNSLADIGEIIGDEIADTEEFIVLLKAIFDKTEIGTIPTSIDEVTIGAADMLRASSPKYTFVIGLCEGEFPASINDKGLLSTPDREILAALDLELSDNSEIRSANELMYVSRAFSSPSEKLFLFMHKAELDGSVRFPSLALNRVEKLFCDSDIVHDFTMSDLEYLTPAPRNAVGLIRSLNNGVVKTSLTEALSDTIPGIKDLTSIPTSTDQCKISPETISRSLGDNLHLSPSSFETYVKCPFSYFCSRVLDLRENGVAKFNSSNIGIFIHYILEVLIKDAIPDDPQAPIISDDEIIRRVDEAIKIYVKRICPPSFISSKRLAHLYKRLRDLAVLLVKNTAKEFSKSNFRPAFYELRTNGANGSPSPLVFNLKDKTQVSFSGIVDRVDIYKNNGDVYIRVVDYKTGTKDFNLDDISHGINLQMLLYLFTLCRSDSAEFKRSIGIYENGRILPAGVIYLSANIPVIEAEDYNSTDNILSEAEQRLKRSGLILNDQDMILAMNHDLDSRFLAGIKTDKDGELVGNALVDKERFERIFNDICNIITSISTNLHDGIADASPLAYKDQDPCQYCNAKAICRKEKV